MTIKWDCSDKPPPMEHWPVGDHGPRMLQENRDGTFEITSRSWDDDGNIQRAKVAGPFPSLEAGKIAWLLMFPVQS